MGSKFGARYRFFFLLLFSAAAAAGIYYYYANSTPRPVNVILITVDTFRPDHLGCTGYKRNTTPFLDTIAQKSTVFSSVISTAPWTCPAMNSIFTGMYPCLHGVQSRGHSLLVNTETIFDVFRRYGYRVPNISYLTNLQNFANLGLDEKDKFYPAKKSRTGDELFTWLNNNHNTAFLVWFHYRFLHLPYNPSEEYNVFVDNQTFALTHSAPLEKVMSDTIIPWKTTVFSPKERDAVVALYDGQLREFDRFTQRLYDTMTHLNLHSNTVLAITADHGEELFEHDYIGHASTAVHATMYDEVLKIPFLIYAPGCSSGSRIIETQVSQIDIMPTLLDIAGLDIPDSVQGRSLRPFLTGKKNIPVLPAFSESNMGGYQSTPEHEKTTLRSIRTGEWKLIMTNSVQECRYQLYDLINDPGETTNLYSPGNDTAAGLRKSLTDMFADMQTQRIALLAREHTSFPAAEIPDGSILETPRILQPRNNDVIRVNDDNLHIALEWTGDRSHTYVIEYDVGEGFKNLKGKIPVQGIRKDFGPLPRDAWEPLPYWNPYRFRVAPYGRSDLWSTWVVFYIRQSPAGVSLKDASGSRHAQQQPDRLQ